jgi:hypothetical protein
MASRVHQVLRVCLALACAAGFPLAGGAQTADPIETSANNLLVVLRESRGENKQREELTPYGRVTAQLANGQRIDLATSWYHYLGDMHIRLVFDGGQTLQSAAPDDLERLRLTPEEALDLAVANLRRVYGAPVVSPWSGGLMQVQGTAPDLASSYFLDRDLWRKLQERHPEGLVAAVPRRGGLVYAPASDTAALTKLRFSAAALFAGAHGTQVSSALYLFKDGHWSVFEPPQPR